MKMKCRNRITIVLLLLAAGVFVWRGRRDGGDQKQIGAPLTGLEPGKVYSRNSNSLDAPEVSRSIVASNKAHYGRALSIPPADVKVLPDDVDENIPIRAISSEDAILAAGGLAVNQAAPQAAGAIDSRKARLKSILAKDWEGQGNLLVNELRAARGFEVPLQTVEDFFEGEGFGAAGDVGFSSKCCCM